MLALLSHLIKSQQKPNKTPCLSVSVFVLFEMRCDVIMIMAFSCVETREEKRRMPLEINQGKLGL